MTPTQEAKLNRRFHRDRRILDARAHYREHIRAGMQEAAAWALFRQVQERVLEQLRARIEKENPS